jgi:hypothetical protein
MPWKSSFATFTLNSTTRTARLPAAGGEGSANTAPYIGHTLSNSPSAASAMMRPCRSTAASTSARASNIAKCVRKLTSSSQAQDQRPAYASRLARQARAV